MKDKFITFLEDRIDTMTALAKEAKEANDKDGYTYHIARRLGYRDSLTRYMELSQIASFQRGWEDVMEGDTEPIEKLWDDL